MTGHANFAVVRDVLCNYCIPQERLDVRMVTHVVTLVSRTAPSIMSEIERVVVEAATSFGYSCKTTIMRAAGR